MPANNALRIAPLRNRREFLKAAARKVIVPAVAVYTIQKTTPKLFAREPD
jgi:hypothetical protein